MTVILVLATFAAFLVIDHIYSRRRGVQPIIVTQPAATRGHEARPVPSFVGGFRVPDNVRYHPGHTWALSESPNLVRVGMDDFAGKLAGNIEAIQLPQRGQWVRQGQKIWSIVRNGVKVDMVSPIEGSVADVNDAISTDPTLASKDPYGEGWIVTVQSPDSKINFRNLIGGALSRVWMEEATTRLAARVPAMAGAFAADGGEIVSDLGAVVPKEKWAEVTKEFFLS
jgi:glycine cleavage system H lipoate-binding protein